MIAMISSTHGHFFFFFALADLFSVAAVSGVEMVLVVMVSLIVNSSLINQSLLFVDFIITRISEVYLKKTAADKKVLCAVFSRFFKFFILSSDQNDIINT